ncbi:hypothetical protein N7470_001305 [Penicillium chermesinum]|nr:hypothetical protein N7470_001305 [Penicillium chermesinum]
MVTLVFYLGPGLPVFSDDPAYSGHPPPRAGHHQIDSALYLTAADFAQRCSLSDLDYPVLVVLS